MKKFMIIYKGEATDPMAMPEEARNAVMQAWAKWMENAGDALVDVGTPLGPNSSVVDDGSDGTAVSLSGYSIVQSEDMAGAKELAKSHPFLSEGKGNFAIDVFEMLPVPMND